jgi:hypothetical protein
MACRHERTLQAKTAEPPTAAEMNSTELSANLSIVEQRQGNGTAAEDLVWQHLIAKSIVLGLSPDPFPARGCRREAHK